MDIKELVKEIKNLPKDEEIKTLIAVLAIIANNMNYIVYILAAILLCQMTQCK